MLLPNPAVPFSIIKSLPGFSGSLPFKLETGYIGVGEKEDVQFFYYFMESEGNPREDPLMLWFTGGPGCSAISGLAFEIGPLQFNMVEYNGSLPTLALNPYSWTKAASIIFVDSPVVTGFSYSTSMQGSKSTDTIHANQGYDFLRKVQHQPQSRSSSHKG
ncbi:serine carboxypeptidase-like 1 [Corylus avellana]|uniref:serine carboxypeptidase-like 1 n=1 Tax=Corylus avellana TaxID=13451 RepID=UPI00286BDF09|nr:serine carboxypeptidase-like 1 [Corylus avellana]